MNYQNHKGTNLPMHHDFLTVCWMRRSRNPCMHA